MIIKDEDAPDRGVTNARFEDGMLIVDYVQDIDLMLKDLQLRRQTQNEGGWSGDRTMRYIGTIPESAIAIRPELATHADEALKFLENEGSEFRVNKVDTGRKGQVITK